MANQDWYLAKEGVGTVSPARMTIAYWAKDKSFRFLESKKKYLTSPVADLGCGHGPLTILTARMGFEVTGFDCVAENIRTGSLWFSPKIEFVLSGLF